MALIKNFCLSLLLVCLILLGGVCGGVSVNADTQQPTSKARLLMDYQTGQIISEFNSKEHLPIASVTKLTTLLLAFEAIDKGELTLDKELIASQHASSMGGSQVFIDANAGYKVENLLHSIIISSANDACVMIAEALAGTEEDFVVKMNEKVRSLGGVNTNYVNCSGLPSPNAYSCANDVALVMKEVLKYPLYFEISKITLEDFVHPSGRVTQMANTNKLLRSYVGCDAGKTGSTNEAGYCMSATAKKGNMRLIAVVLGAENSKDRFSACAQLFDWGFANFSCETILDSSKDLNVDFQIDLAKEQTNIRPAENYSVLVKKGEKPNITTNYEFLKIKAPLKSGSVVGKAIITNNGVVLKEIDLISTQDVQAKSIWDTTKDIIAKW